MPFLKSLNPVQRQAVTFGDGPLLILAGAGSGKTRVLASRVAYLVNARGIPPENILAVTFTNKAAGEMRERLKRLIGFESSNLWLGTFHSLGLRIIRREMKAAGAATELTVYNDEDQLSIIKECMRALSINEKTFAPKAIAGRINEAKNSNIGPAEYANYATDFLSERVSKVYSLYQKRLREMGCLDFGDLICEPINLLKNNPKVLESYQQRFQYILVDEYQDTNKAQYQLTNMLASGTRNLLAVGDPDQSIYAWRGADISNILDFEKDYPDATVLKLEQNYRSTRNILSAANAVIQNNLKRLEKDLWTENPGGEQIVYEEAKDEYSEARTVIKKIKGLVGRGTAYRDTAVFYRTNAQSRVFEEHLIREGVPYVIIGGVKFYDRREIKDSLAYLRIISNPNDLVSLQRVINTPPRGVGDVTLAKVKALAEQKAIPVFESFREALDKGLLAKTRVKEFIEAVDDFRIDIGRLSIHELALRLLEDSGYMMMWQEEKTDEAQERVENIFELISAIKDFEAANPDASLSDFLDHVALISDIDNYAEESDRLALMTMHSAKGLEFKVVFIVGMEDGIFPHSRSANNPEELEEERRLCYVGMTRAMERLFLSGARSRNVYGETRYQMRSRFISEIPEEYITFAGEDASERPPYTYNGDETFSGKDSFKKPSQARGPDEVYYTNEGNQTLSCTDEFEPLAWRVGMMVKHQTFGIGIIKQRAGTGDDTKLTINFKDAGIKKLVVRYANLTPAGQ